MRTRAVPIVGMLSAIFVFGGLEMVDAASLDQPPSVHIDTDHDGLTDEQEKLFGTDPLRADTDEDGYPDGMEVQNGYAPTSTSRVRLVKRLRIHLKSQMLERELGGIVFATHRISTGRKGMRTPTGTFHVLSKKSRAWSRRAKLWMPWWMAFSSNGLGIHELPEWPNGKKEGATHLGTPVSGGCVRVGIDAAKTLYDWTPVGTQIVIIN